MEAKKTKKTKSPLFPLQYMGYFLAGFDTERDDFNFNDFVEQAKFYLCQQRNVLTKDPVWDKYTVQEIIREYYAVLYSKNKGLRDEFEMLLASDGEVENEADWLEQAVSRNRSKIEELKKDATSKPEVVEFDPNKE